MMDWIDKTLSPSPADLLEIYNDDDHHPHPHYDGDHHQTHTHYDDDDGLARQASFSLMLVW